MENLEKTNRLLKIIILLLAIPFAVIFICIVNFFFNQWKAQKDYDERMELESYEIAIRNDDPLVIGAYLNNYEDCNKLHTDSAKARLEYLKSRDSIK